MKLNILYITLAKKPRYVWKVNDDDDDDDGSEGADGGGKDDDKR